LEEIRETIFRPYLKLICF